MANLWDYLFQPITNNPEVYDAYWDRVHNKKKKEIHKHIHFHQGREEVELLEQDEEEY